MDYNSLIGSILIFFILIGFIYFNHSIDKKILSYKISSSRGSASIPTRLNKTPSNFFNTGNIGESLLENDVLRIKISNLGGQIKEVLLKTDYINTATYKNIFLVKPGTFSFRLNLNSLQNQEFSSQNLFFIPDLQETNRAYTLHMTAYLPSGGKLCYTYSLPKKIAYHVDFHIHTRGLRKFHFSHPISIDWIQNLMNLEKSWNWENNYTQMYYAYTTKRIKNKVKYLSEHGSDYKIVHNVNWLANKQQFFISMLFPEKPFEKAILRSNTLAAPSKILHPPSNLKSFHVSYPLELCSNEIDYRVKWYFTPLDYHLLKSYGQNFENIIPFGWGLLKWINTYFFLMIFQILEKTHLNYGLIIIFMTIVVKLILSPITYRQYRLNAMMKVIRPDIEALNLKLKDANPLTKQKATLELYRKTGVNPMEGCLPALLQIPIFYALFKFFPTIINLREKSFLWADNLTSYDSIYHLPFFIPIYGDHVSLFTLLYAVALWMYTKISGTNNISESPQADVPNVQMMMYFMPIIMLLFINNYASGLSLYYFISNTINIISVFIIKRYFLDEKSVHKKIQKFKSQANKNMPWPVRIQNIIYNTKKKQAIKKNIKND